MKKFILLLLSAALMLCVFAACSNDTPTTDTAADTGTVQTDVPTDVLPVSDTGSGIVLPVDTLG